MIGLILDRCRAVASGGIAGRYGLTYTEFLGRFFSTGVDGHQSLEHLILGFQHFLLAEGCLKCPKQGVAGYCDARPTAMGNTGSPELERIA